MLNNASPLPLYRQLGDLLTEQIRRGQYAVGTRIPSEPALSERFGIGRPTVRQATDLLVRRGLLERRRGSGTYVREPAARVELFSLVGTMRSFEERGLTVTPEVLVPLSEVTVPDEGRDGFHRLAGNPFAGLRALTFTRRSNLDGAPVLLERFFLDPERFAGVQAFDLARRSLSEVVQYHLYEHPEQAEQVFDVVVPDAGCAAQLDLAPDTPLLRVRRHIDFPGAPGAIYVELLCRTEQLAFCQTIPGMQHA